MLQQPVGHMEWMPKTKQHYFIPCTIMGLSVPGGIENDSPENNEEEEGREI